jgi:hypothetical protein
MIRVYVCGEQLALAIYLSLLAQIEQIYYIGNYRLIRLLAEGDFVEVCLGTLAAIKVL